MVTFVAAIPLYRRRTSQDDIERGKVRYHQVRIFARIFLQIRTSPGKSMVARCFVDGQRLWTRFPALSKPYFSMSWDFGSERAGNRIHSFGCLTEAWIISAMYVIITWWRRVKPHDTYPIYLFLEKSNARTHINGTPPDSWTMISRPLLGVRESYGMPTTLQKVL